jgi:DNA-binding GntR family transcriptional regulator
MGPVEPFMKRTTALPKISLDRSPTAQSLRKQIERQLVSAIRSGALPCNCRLPSSRLLATLLNVSRGTVVDAYDALLQTGLLTAKEGSGIMVTPSTPGVPNFSNLRRTARAAHLPVRVLRFEDWDGTSLYLNLIQ